MLHSTFFLVQFLSLIIYSIFFSPKCTKCINLFNALFPSEEIRCPQTNFCICVTEGQCTLKAMWMFAVILTQVQAWDQSPLSLTPFDQVKIDKSHRSKHSPYLTKTKHISVCILTGYIIDKTACLKIKDKHT